MAKKVVLVVVVLAIAAGAWFGASKYYEARNTPERAAQVFMQNLAARNVTKTYEQFTSSLQTSYKQTAWNDLVKSLGLPDAQVTPIVVTDTAINDRFNVYLAKSSPHRFVYDINAKGRQYRVVTVILKQDNTWKIDDVQGSYK